MKSEAQAAAVVALRRGIWNWIEMFPNEYNEVVSGTRRLDGAPERLFDILYQISETRNKNAMWPTLNLLMVISHERISQLALNPGRTVGTNKPTKKVLSSGFHNETCSKAFLGNHVCGSDEEELTNHVETVGCFAGLLHRLLQSSCPCSPESGLSPSFLGCRFL